MVRTMTQTHQTSKVALAHISPPSYFPLRIEKDNNNKDENEFF